MTHADNDRRNAIILLSGGLDSATAAAVARDEGWRLHALTVAYGQRHVAELEAARRVAAALGVADHRELAIDLGVFGGSALTDDLPVPKADADAPVEPGIPITYVPARNTILLACALAYAEVVDARAIFLGVSAVDYSGYPDCRPAFVEAFEQLAAVATRAGVEGRPIDVRAPLVRLSKAETIALGVRLGVDYSLTHSCYDPADDGSACGRCESCRLRRAGFEAAGIPDPTRYQT
jgi:7-cyano-7-deazaguanine synthase